MVTASNTNTIRNTDTVGITITNSITDTMCSTGSMDITNTNSITDTMSITGTSLVMLAKHCVATVRPPAPLKT